MLLQCQMYFCTLKSLQIKAFSTQMYFCILNSLRPSLLQLKCFLQPQTTQIGPFSSAIYFCTFKSFKPALFYSNLIIQHQTSQIMSILTEVCLFNLKPCKLWFFQLKCVWTLSLFTKRFFWVRLPGGARLQAPTLTPLPPLLLGPPKWYELQPNVLGVPRFCYVLAEMFWRFPNEFAMIRMRCRCKIVEVENRFEGE